MMSLTSAASELVVALTARTSHPVDAVIRVLGDAQRYGFGLETLEITKANSGVAEVTMALRVPSATDIDNIRDRFSRHDVLSEVVVAAA